MSKQDLITLATEQAAELHVINAEIAPKMAQFRANIDAIKIATIADGVKVITPFFTITPVKEHFRSSYNMDAIAAKFAEMGLDIEDYKVEKKFKPSVKEEIRL